MRILPLILLIASFTSSADSNFDLNELTVPELQERMASGKETSRSLVDKYLARIKTIDKILHSVLEINPDARAIADRLDAERKSGKVRGPLHGIPVLLKDNIATHDRMQTTAGSYALVGSQPIYDSEVAGSLRKAGAVILGKANLSEWANIRSTHSSSGWSARGGQTRNPYALDRSPCGSSSGSAVAVSANLVAIAVGTETMGSIVCPSSMNGVVGIKPTVGLVSTIGIIPISHSQDTAGPITRSVTDAAILLTALSNRGINYASNLKADGLKGARIGVVRKDVTGHSPGTDKLFESAIADLKRLGATVIDPTDIEGGEDIWGDELNVLLYELKANMNKYLVWAGSSRVRTLQDLINFNKTHHHVEMPLFDQDLFEKAQAKGSLSDTSYKASLAKIQKFARGAIDDVMKRFKLDALLAPSSGPAFLIDHVNGDSFEGGSAMLAAVSGYPHVTVPTGFVSGLPVGLSFFGRAYSEPALIQFAFAYEQATKHRKEPHLRTTASVP